MKKITVKVSITRTYHITEKDYQEYCEAYDRMCTPVLSCESAVPVANERLIDEISRKPWLINSKIIKEEES